MLDKQEKKGSTPTVVPGAALPWQVLGRVGGFMSGVPGNQSLNTRIYVMVLGNLSLNTRVHVMGSE